MTSYHLFAHLSSRIDKCKVIWNCQTPSHLELKNAKPFGIQTNISKIIKCPSNWSTGIFPCQRFAPLLVHISVFNTLCMNIPYLFAIFHRPRQLILLCRALLFYPLSSMSHNLFTQYIWWQMSHQFFVPKYSGMTINSDSGCTS